MCLFPSANLQFNSLAYKKGIREFDCGACPECLHKRSNVWVLRSVFEAKLHKNNCMITLTYDNFVRDASGKICGETPVNPDLKVNQRDVQLFIKRLRKWHTKTTGQSLKYIACAEYGSRTHRAHYHLILFNVKFPDAHVYKRSKRGNCIYMSKTLTDLWNHGICTIDCTSVHSAIARYCTKYCAKERSDKTFMLTSQKIGFLSLKSCFDGKSYFIEGREYPVPRFIWEDYIVNKYQKRYQGLNNVPLLSPKYVNRDKNLDDFTEDFYYARSKKQRAFYRAVRDRDPLYVGYLDYWRRKGLQFEQHQVSPLQRIYNLDDRKYHKYRIAALACYSIRQSKNLHSRFPIPAPGSNCVSQYWHKVEENRLKFGFEMSLAPSSRPNRASDTKLRAYQSFCRNIYYPVGDKIVKMQLINDIPPDFCNFSSSNFQISLDNLI